MAQAVPVQWKPFLIRIILPTILTVALFVLAIYRIIIPTIEQNSLNHKREMIRELTNSAWNILAKFEYDEQQGLMSRAQAQARAVEQIRNLHYGQQMKDYFWINDMHPRMVIHPYRTDLNGKDLSEYRDPEGRAVFVEMVQLVQKSGSGYVRYMWQWKDDEQRIVPKISYVKGFSPWGWIIGTGIYIEDVQAEVGLITRDLISVSLVIVAFMGLLLTTIILYSYRTEKQRSSAELALRQSEEKYRTLVESASEGMFMCLGGRYIYSNQRIARLLEYDQAEFGRLQTYEIFPDDKAGIGYQTIQALIAGKSVPDRFEAQLKTKTGRLVNVILATSEIFVGGRMGFIAVATDITKRKEAEDALGASEKKFRTLANNLNVGLFRRTAGKTPRFVEVNPALIDLLGFDSKEELLGFPVPELYLNPEEMKRLGPKSRTGRLEREIVKLRRKDGSIFSASIWAVAIKDDQGEIQCFDGIVEDVTDIVSREDEQSRLLEEMQSAMLYMNQPVESLPTEAVVTCPGDIAVREAVSLMNRHSTDILLVQAADGRSLGALTDLDIRKKVLGRDGRMDRPVSEIMSAPAVTIPAQSCLFEAGLLMEQNSISHLFVTGPGNEVNGVLQSGQVSAVQKYSPAVLLQELREARTPDDIIRLKSSILQLFTSLIDNGAKPLIINHLNTAVTDTLLQRLIEFAIRDLGLPPVRFSFIVFGSEGRREQTLSTDQDNAIVYEDPSPETADETQRYFLQLGEKVCGWLDQAGYHFCEGDNMAKVPAWCRPLSMWQQYFTDWISTGAAEDLLQTKIFFDFRSAFGDRELADRLRAHLNDVIDRHPRFFQLLARNVLQIAPPIGLFGKFVVEPVGGRGKAFDIKSAMMPIVDYARIYALQQKIDATNTVERLKQLHLRNLLSQQNYQEVVQAYTYLMQIRLQAQADSLSRGSRNPDNYIRPDSLSYIDQKLLKEIFSQTKNFQAKLSYDFTGRLEGV